jgi:DMSO/TMAO reductase YedYZ molybdopterin-dependent catalytic subunit
MSSYVWTRRQILLRGSVAFGGALLGGCDRLSQSRGFQSVLASAGSLNYRLQRALIGQSLAPEFTEADLSPQFRSNGTSHPGSAIYNELLSNQFEAWRLVITGLVKRPQEFSLAQLRRMPPRTQITRHDCVEGWSAIGKWTGVPLANVLNLAQLESDARFIVFYCADELAPNDGGYYESIDLIDAFHPQTVLAYELNGRPLPVGNGAPLRLRIERQLGYKHAKYIMRIEVVARLDNIKSGKGGYWEDRGYQWYAGI